MGIPRASVLFTTTGLPTVLAATVLAVSLAGCGDSHSRDDGGPALDTGTARDTGQQADAVIRDYVCECCPGVTVLGGSPESCSLACAGRCNDAGVSCGPLAAQVVCFEDVRADRPIEVEVTLTPTGRDCYCDQAMSCQELFGGHDGVSLETGLCPEIGECRACQPPPVGSCALAPREGGTERVRIQGLDAFDLEVAAADVPPSGARTCVRTAQVDACGAVWAPTALSSDRACHPRSVRAGTRVSIRVEDACGGGCTQIGPCAVTVTGDLIVVNATRMPNACDIACEPVCEHTEHVCVTPPLTAGLYNVLVPGLMTEGGSELTTVLEVTESGFSGSEICGGIRG